MVAKWKQPKLTIMFPTVHNSGRRKLIPSNKKDFDRNAWSCFCQCWQFRNRQFSKKYMFNTLLLLCLASFVGFSIYNRIETANHFRLQNLQKQIQLISATLILKCYFCTRILHQDVQHLTKHFKLRKCNFPKLQPFGDDVLPHLSKHSSIDCMQSANPIGEIVFVQQRGKRILWKVKDTDGDCCYRPFHRESDSDSRYDLHEDSPFLQIFTSFFFLYPQVRR